MTAILKVDTIQDTAGNNIINENANTITIGKSGDTVNLAAGSSLTSPGLTLSDNILFDTANKGIYLGVTSATASNLLDDYEEGTWTPTAIGTTSGNYTVGDSATKGAYTKIGRMVTVSGEIHLTAKNSPVGSFAIGNLPFSCANLTELAERSVGSVTTKYIDFDASCVNLATYISSGLTQFYIIQVRDNNTTLFTDTTAVESGDEIIFTLTYPTDS